MKKYFKYFKTICIHKWYVFIECCKQGIIWQGPVHDLSKFSPAEFIASTNYYEGNGDYLPYQYAWLHHKGHNKHHWEYWVDWDSSTGKYIVTKIPLRYLKEMYADFVGASKAYNKGKYSSKMPYQYYVDNCKGWVIDPESKKWFEDKLLKDISILYR